MIFNRLFSITLVALCIISQASCQRSDSQNRRMSFEISSSQGGNINIQNQLSIYFPPGTVLNDQTGSVTQLSGKPAGDEKDILFMGDYFEIKAGQEIFYSPILITLNYDEEIIPEGRSEGEIFAVFLYEGTWYRTNGEVDRVKNTITVKSYHASIWSWGMEKIEEDFLGYHASMFNCIFNRQDPSEIPSTLSDAYLLRDQRLQEWKDTIHEADLSLHRLDSNLEKRLDELGIDWTNDMYGEIALESEMAIAELAGVTNIDKVLVIEVGKNIMGVYSLIKSSIQALQTDMLSGDVLAVTLKIKAAQQRYMAAKAYVYAFENPDAKTLPDEYLKALDTVCATRTIVEDNPETDGSCFWEDVIVGDWNGVSGNMVIAQLSMLSDGTVTGVLYGANVDIYPVQGSWKCSNGYYYFKRSDEVDYLENPGTVNIINNDHIQIGFANGSFQEYVRK